MITRELERALRYLQIVDLNASGVTGEIFYIKDLLEEELKSNKRMGQNLSLEERKKGSDRMKKYWKEKKEKENEG